MKSILFIILSYTSVCFCSLQKSDVLPLYRQKPVRETALQMFLTNKTLFDSVFVFENKRNSTNDTQALFRYLDSEFYAIIRVGKKARSFNLLLDTSWGHTWIISKDCAFLTPGCWFHNKYDHRKSSSYVKNGTIYEAEIGGYNMSGYLSLDTFYFDHLNVTNQTFIEMVRVPPTYLLSKGDGILGLGRFGLANGVVPIFYNLYKQNKITKQLFSIYLNRDKQSNRGGEIIFGRIEPKHILKNHTMLYLNVFGSSYWQFKMDRAQIDINNKTYAYCLNKCYAIADTSGNQILGPDNEIEKLNELIGARKFYLGYYMIDCATINKLPPLTFILKDKEFPLSGEDYTQKVSVFSYTFCLSAFGPSGSDQWLLGGAFLSRYYSVYNIKDKVIGFVKAS